MSVETINIDNKATSFAERDILASAAYAPSTLEKIEAELRARGSLFGRWPNQEQFDSFLGDLGSFATERVIGFTPALANSERDTMYVGGVCALSTRESTLVGRGLVEDPIDGGARFVKDSDGISDAITTVQVFETIGLTPDASAIVLEDKLWSDRTIDKMRGRTEMDDDLEQTTRQAIETRNQRSYEALQKLRTYIFGETRPVEIVRDAVIMDELIEKTDKMLVTLGLPTSENSYRFVYAGMYSYVWREILKNQGIVKDDQTMAIYEPWKHFAPEDGWFDTISTFRGRLLKEAPFMREGSANEQVGLIAYMEPRDPNGRLIRKSVPIALLPNSKNFVDFDFGRFPVVPKKTNALPNADEFQFADDIATLTLSQNPAFLWGLVYPPTDTTVKLMRDMAAISVEAKAKSKAVFQDNMELSIQDKQQLSKQLKRSYSCDIAQLSEQLVSEFQNMTSAMFGASDETK